MWRSQGATLFLATEVHEALLTAKPEKNPPERGGSCAYGVGLGKWFPMDINTWQVRNENWEFDKPGRMKFRFASINDLPIKEADRRIRSERKA